MYAPQLLAPLEPDTLAGVCTNKQYTLGNAIARGAHATVFRASCPSLPDVAVKFVPLGRQDDVDMIKNEVSIVNRLTHPHVVRTDRIFQGGWEGKWVPMPCTEVLGFKQVERKGSLKRLHFPSLTPLNLNLEANDSSCQATVWEYAVPQVRIDDYVVHPSFRNQDGTTGAVGLVMELAKGSLKVLPRSLVYCHQTATHSQHIDSLQGYIVSRPNMDEASVRWLFQQLMLAVDYCHGKCCPR
jgi:serine/threonine protein kinase